MANWYATSDTWFSANEVGAWTPATTATAPHGTPTTITAKSASLKPLKQQPPTLKTFPEAKQPSKTKKITESGTAAPPQTGDVKFHALPSNAATHQGAWDAYIVTEDPLQRTISPCSPPQLSSHEFTGGWDSTTSPTKSEKEEDDESNSSNQKPKRNSDIEDELIRQNLYKTELCLSWAETGACRYGGKCQFAHGKQELRPVLRHPKYKTEVCKTFSNTGHCPYGKRCRFVHQLYEFRSPSADLEPELSIVPEEDETTAEIQQKLNELNLSMLAPDPVFPGPPEIEAGEQQQKKGSRLPFFQKLRKQKW